MAQMDISSIPLTKPTRLAPSSTSQQQQQHLTMQQQQMQQQPPRPRPAIKMRSSGSVTTMNITTAQTTAPIVRNSKGGNVNGSNGGGGSTVGVVRRIGTGSNNNLSASSAGPTTTTTGGGGFVVSVGKGTTGTGTGTLATGGRRGSARREGSVTSSDDGTVSEDSVEDPIQLFSGGGGLHINGLPFGQSLTSRSSSGPKKASSSSVVSAAGSGVGVRTRGSSSSTLSTTAKPMRIAAGAAIKVNNNSFTAPPSSTNTGGATTTSGASAITIPSLSVISASSSGHSLTGLATSNGGGVLSSSLSSSTSSSSLSWVGSPSQRNSIGYEPRSPSPTFSTPALSSQLQQLQQQQQQSLPPPPTSPNSASQNVSRTATFKTSTSGAASVAAASKLAEENRRQEEAARTRRKIADLEISNTSLLQINQTLEATIRKQTAEMQELKTRMQSAQFGGDLSWMTSSQDQDSSLMGTMTATTTPEAAVMIHELTEAERQADMTFKRLCLTIDQMLFEAKQALDQSSKPAGVKVLSSFDMYEKEAMEDDELDTADQSIVIDEDDIDAIGGGIHTQTEEQEPTPAAMPTATHTAITAA
ncbi:hypothetical protein BGW39_000073 [Mortierella sp. 14UC]|nr:hypothetical protein BGW39_000073 [Mortierella sp. 14UC]